MLKSVTNCFKGVILQYDCEFGYGAARRDLLQGAFVLIVAFLTFSTTYALLARFAS